MSCNNSGYFYASLFVSDEHLKGLTIGDDRSFGFSNASVSITRQATGLPIDFYMSANFGGLQNLKLEADFVVSPFQSFSAFVSYTAPADSDVPHSKRRRRRAGIDLICI